MKRNELVQRLIKEGMSEKTLVNFSDIQIRNLAERMLGEATSKMTKVYSMSNPKDAADVNNLVSDPAQLQAALKSGHIQVTKEEQKPTEKQLNTLDKNKNKKIDKEDFKLLRKGKKEEVKEEKPSAGLSKEKKSEIVKKAIKGGDIGKKGKGFKEVEKSAKKSGAKDPEAVAAAAMWKNIKKESIEVKNWVNQLAEENYHSFTSKSEIMELVQNKMENTIEYGPNVKKGHNDVPEFMSYDSITKSEVKESGTKTKPAPTKPKTSPNTKPKTPYQPGPGKNPKPKALKEDK